MRALLRVVISPLPRLMCVPHRMCRKIFVGTAFENGVVWALLVEWFGKQFCGLTSLLVSNKANE